MLKHIFLNDSSGYHPTDAEDDHAINNLSKINIFVGANNSGKSRLIRRILTRKFDAIRQYSKVEIEQLPYNIAHSKMVQSPSDHFAKGNREYPDNEPNHKFIKKIITENKPRINEWATQRSLGFCYDSLLQTKTAPRDRKMEFEVNFKKLFQVIYDKSRQSDSSILSEFNTIYFPLLRGLRPLIDSSSLIKGLGLPEIKANNQHEHEQVSIPLTKRIESIFGEVKQNSLVQFRDFYKQATERDYAELKTNGTTTYTGLQIYSDIKKALLGTEDQRNSVRNFEAYLSTNFFDGKTIELVPREDKDQVLHVKIGDDSDREIHSLGDGVQSIISILYPLFTQLRDNQEYLIGIEEPEANLHPGLQRQLVKALLSIKNCQFFLTTHSNHFLETLFDYDDISLYRVRPTAHEKEHYKQVDLVSNDSKDILRDLGVLSTSLFLSNCTIWVEGITDRLYLRKYLNCYQEYLKQSNGKVHELLEDKHFSFVEYAGSNITHWSFLDEESHPIDVDKLCSTSMLVIDDDNATGKKLERQEELSRKLGSRFVKLDAKEIENLLSPEILSKLVSSYSKTKPAFDICSQWTTYQKKPLGKFLDKRITDKSFEMSGKKKKFTSDNTISGKLSFCKKAIGLIDTWDDLTDEAQRVTIEIYKFIQTQNPDC